MKELPTRLKIFLAATLIVGAVMLLVFTIQLSDRSLDSVGLGIGLFLALSVVAAVSPVRLPRGGIMTVAFAVDFACVLIYGPQIAAWACGLSALFLLHRHPAHRILFNAAQLVITLGLTGVVYQAAGGMIVDSTFQAGSRVEFPQQVVPMALAGVTYLFVNLALVGIAIALAQGRPLVGTWLVNFRWMAPQFLALAPFGVLMAMVYQAPQQVFDLPGRVIALSLFLFPLFWARYAFKGYVDMKQIHSQTIQALVNGLEAYDVLTKNHSETVSQLAEMIARQLRFPETRMEALLFAARLHDIGKFVMETENILNKPGSLTPEEWAIVHQHPAAGAQIVGQVEAESGVAAIVRATHERPDGKGYPDGLEGRQIDLAASIIAVADAFHAMTSDRPYRRAMPVEKALRILQEEAGAQFDRRAVQAMVALCESGQLEPQFSLQMVADATPA